MGEFNRRPMMTLPTRSKRHSDGKSTMLLGGVIAGLFLICAVILGAWAIPSAGFSWELIVFMSFMIGMMTIGAQIFLQGRRNYLQSRFSHAEDRLAFLYRQAAGRQDMSKPFWLLDHAWKEEGIEDNSNDEIAFGFQNFITIQCVMLVFHAGILQAVTSGQLYSHVFFFVLMFVLFLIVDCMSLAYLARAIRAGLSRWRHGSSFIQFVNPPFEPGGSLTVHFYPPRTVLGPRREGTLGATLRYTEETESRGRKDRAWLSRESVYSDVARIPFSEIQSNPRGEQYFEIKFDIPRAGKQSRLTYRPARYWELEITGDIPGIDFIGRYLVPVYYVDPVLARAADEDEDEFDKPDDEVHGEETLSKEENLTNEESDDPDA